MRRSTSCARKDACERHAPAAYAGGLRRWRAPSRRRAPPRQHPCRNFAPSIPRSGGTPFHRHRALVCSSTRHRRASAAPHPAMPCETPSTPPRQRLHRPCTSIRGFGNNLRLLQRVRPLFPSATMRPIDANRLTRRFAQRSLGRRRGSALFRPQEAHSTEIMVENLEFSCKFGNYFRRVLQGRRIKAPRA